MIGSICIIGDQHKDGSVLKDALKKDTHFSVRQVAIAPRTVAELTKTEPNLLIFNPDKSYLESMDVYYALKKEAALQEIPILFLIDENEMKSADLPSGVHEVLCRPLRITEALARVKHLFKKIHRVDEKNIIRRGKLSMDVTKYEVRIGDRKIDLTYTEFELLKFLCGNPGTVFTREILLSKVWGYEYFGGTRTVDVHIRRLRSKIESKSDNFIETIRNIGYKFISEE